MLHNNASIANLSRRQLQKYVKFRVNCQRFTSDFKQIWNLLTEFHEILSMKFHVKIRPQGATLIRADRRPDMTKLIGAFRDYAEVPKKLVISSVRATAIIQTAPIFCESVTNQPDYISQSISQAAAIL